MKVRELVEMLGKLNPEAEVVHEDFTRGIKFIAEVSAGWVTPADGLNPDGGFSFDDDAPANSRPGVFLG